MDPIKKAFITLALKHGALKFGSFVLKSGRTSPWFFNAGLFYQAEALKEIGNLYATALINSRLSFDTLFGPAYKGITLASSTAIALTDFDINVGITFNRKEVKDHGEGGILSGAPLAGHQVIIIDDVITAGTAFREARDLVEAAGATISGVVIALDRAERGSNTKNARREIEDSGIPVIALADVFDIIEYCKTEPNIEQYNITPAQIAALYDHTRT